MRSERYAGRPVGLTLRHAFLQLDTVNTFKQWSPVTGGSDV